MNWQRLHTLLFYDYQEKEVVGWRTILRRFTTRRKSRFPRIQLALVLIICSVPFCCIGYPLYAMNNFMWETELRNSSEMAWRHAAEEAYDRGDRKLLELTKQADFGSSFTGRKVDIFEVWTHEDGRLLRTIPFVKGASEFAAEGYVAGWNRGMLWRAERTARRNLKLVISAERAFRAAHNVYTLSFAELGKETPFSSTAGETNSVEGYAFALSGTPDCFLVRADPTVPGVTGEEHYYADCSGRRFYSRLHPAGPGDIEINEKESAEVQAEK
jgi:hypothetical protein